MMAPLTSLGLASPALAKEPTGEFAVFKQCPRFTTGVNFCIFTQTLSGEVTIGKQTVPLEKTITLQGGIIRNEETEAETLVGALNGESLSKTPQKVPGGLLGINCKLITGEGLLEKLARGACALAFESGPINVYATTELVGQPVINKNNLNNQEGTALKLPVRVHLENSALGGECYIGSPAKPITLNLTSGKTSPPLPNKSISGKVGETHFNEAFTLVELTGNSLVDNSFAAPEAEGCKLFGFPISFLVNAKLGLPSAAGTNTAIQNNTIKEAEAAAVIASEK
jgi:hypothetical protein